MASSKRELVLKALNREPVDRVPVGFWHHYLEEERLTEGYGEAVIEEVLAGARKYRDDFDPDLVKVMTDGYFYLPITIKAKTAKELTDFEPVSADDAWFRDQVKLSKGYREIYGDDIFLFYNIFAPLAHLRYALGQGLGISEPETNELLLSFIEEDPESVKAALSKIADNLSELLPKVIGEGLSDGIYLSVSDNHRFIPDALYRLYVTPSDKKILEVANEITSHNILHICGWRGNTNFISVYQDYPAEVFNWAVNTESLSLRQGIEFFGGKTVLGGFLNNETSILYKGTKAQVQNTVRKILADTGRTGVIIGADCTVPNDIDVEHLKWVREAAAEVVTRIAI